MKQLVDHQNPVVRTYDKDAKIDAKVLADKVFYDEGYRIADKDENIRLSPADFEVLAELGQVRALGEPAA